MKTTVLGVRLNDYQREKLKAMAGDKGEAELVRELINEYIEEKHLNCVRFISGSRNRNLDPQKFLDEIAKELLNE